MASGGMGLAPFLWGEGGQRLSADEVARRRALAQSLIPQQAPRDYWSGINSIVGNIGGALHNWQADQAETAGRSEYEGLLAQALESGATDIASLAPLLTHDFASSGGSALGQALLNQTIRQDDPLYQLQLEEGQLGLEQARNPFQASPATPDQLAPWGITPQPNESWTIGPDGLPQQVFAPAPAPAPIEVGGVLVDPTTYQPVFDSRQNAVPSNVQEYEYYAQQAQSLGEQPVPYIEWDTARKAAGATNISNVVGGGETGPKLGSLSTDYGYVLDENGQPVIDPETGLPTAAPVPGSPAAREIADEAARAGSLQDDQAAYARTVTQDLGVAASYLNEIPEWAQGDGVMASNLRAQRANIAGTPEYNMRRFTESALDNVVLDTMNRMRQGSAAGATGFGNMNQQQVEIIRGVLGRWDPALPLKDQRYIFDRLNNFYMDVQFGTPTERAGAVRDGRMTQEENDAIEQFYATETRDIRGRDLGEGGATPPAQPQPNQSQANPDILNGIGEGTVIENDQGQRLVLRNGQWVEEI